MNALEPLRVPLLGRVIVEASAGTGKTFAITTLYVRLLLERGLDVASILVVTYTRAATAELRERVRGRLLAALALLEGASVDDADLVELFAARASDAQRAEDRGRLRTALRDFDEAAIFTIHAFCQRVLTDHALETVLPFAFRVAENDDSLVHELVEDFWSQRTHNASRSTLDALRVGKVDVLALERLARSTLRDDGTKLLPDKLPKSAKAAQRMERFVLARRRAAELFRADRESLLRALCADHNALRRTNYSIARIEKNWVPVLDAFEQQVLPDVPYFLPRLTPSALREVDKTGRFPAEHPFFRAVEELLAIATDVLSDHAVTALQVRRALVDHARAALAARHRERAELGFDDLLQVLHRALLGASGDTLSAALAARYPAALIDEFQDTDPIQYAVFRRIYADHDATLCMIGDPKQAIYGFRGADVFAYVRAAREAGPSVFTLDVNWRSDPSLVLGVHTLFSRAPQPFVLESIRLTPTRAAGTARDHLKGDEDHPLQLLHGAFRYDSQVPRRVAAEITALLNGPARLGERSVAPEDIAVLCRTNKQARDIQTELAKLRVPSVLDGDRSVFESDTTKDLVRVLAAVAAPTDGRSLAAALLGPMLGVDVPGLLEMVSTDVGFEPWAELFGRLHELWRTRGFVRMFQALLEQAHVQMNLLREPDGERLLTDLLHLGELLHEVSSRERMGPEALLAWLRQRQHDPRLGLVPESTQLRLEHDERALRLTTVHRSKGLQYPIVFVPYAWSFWKPESVTAVFHEPEGEHRRCIDLGSEDVAEHRALAEREERAEATRLLYVAVTRAKHRCYLLCSSDKSASVSALVYVLYQRVGVVEPLAVEGRFERLKEAERIAELCALAAAEPAAIGLRAIDEREPARYLPPAEAEAELSPRVARRALSRAARTTSFSRLVADSDDVSAPVDEGADVDAQAAPASLAYALADRAAPASAPAKVPLHDFPAGTGPGTLIHSIYEHLDFTRPEPAAIRAVAEPLLARHRLASAFDLDVLARALADTLRTPLDAAGELRLCRVSRRDRRDEVELTLATAHAPRQLSAGALAWALERTAALPACPSYYARLAALPRVDPAQHLKGFMDLVFRCDGRYYVADYKSNLLGAQPADYAQPGLLLAMSEHHYFLQGYLYALALHRHLQLKLAGYEHARHFGGVLYLFVRGMSEAYPSGNGVWFDRPSEPTLEALSAALGATEQAS